MMNGNISNGAMNMNGNNMSQFGMPINNSQKNLLLNNNPHFNNMNNFAAVSTNNQDQRSYKFKQMDPNIQMASNPLMSGNLRGSLNTNLQNNLVNGSNPTDGANQESNISNSPATAQVFFALFKYFIEEFFIYYLLFILIKNFNKG